MLLKVSNDDIHLVAGEESGNIILSEDMSTLLPPLWNHPPTFIFNDSPYLFFDRMTDNLQLDDIQKTIQKYQNIKLYIAAAGYQRIDQRGKDPEILPVDTYIKRIAKTKDKETVARLHAIFKKRHITSGYKGDLHAVLFTGLLEEKLNISIERMLVEEDSVFCAEVGVGLAETNQHKANAPYFLMQATTLSNLHNMDDGGISPPFNWMQGTEPDELTSLAYLGGRYEVGLNYQKAVNAKPEAILPVTHYLKEKLLAEHKKTGLHYPKPIDDLVVGERVMKNNLGRLIMFLAVLSPKQREEERLNYKINKMQFNDAYEKAKRLVSGVRDHALIDAICLYNLLSEEERGKIKAMLVVDGSAPFLSGYDEVGLKQLFDENKHQHSFHQKAYRYYKSTMQGHHRPYMNMNGLIQQLRSLNFWDVLSVKPENRQETQLNAAMERLRKNGSNQSNPLTH